MLPGMQQPPSSKAYGGPGAVPLCEFPGQRVRVHCTKCERKGAYRLNGLIEKYGSRRGLPEVLGLLSSDCPRRRNKLGNDGCGAYYPDLIEADRAKRRA
jgi:hypothetical protein